MRASSLSNLADICSGLQYSVQSHLQEVLLCVRDVALSDPAVEVRFSVSAILKPDRMAPAQARRGAVHVVTVLARNLPEDSITVRVFVYYGNKHGRSLILVVMQMLPEELTAMTKLCQAILEREDDDVTR